MLASADVHTLVKMNPISMKGPLLETENSFCKHSSLDLACGFAAPQRAITGGFSRLIISWHDVAMPCLACIDIQYHLLQDAYIESLTTTIYPKHSRHRTSTSLEIATKPIPRIRAPNQSLSHAPITNINSIACNENHHQADFSCAVRDFSITDQFMSSRKQ
jgi:hypothetical protein